MSFFYLSVEFCLIPLLSLQRTTASHGETAMKNNLISVGETRISYEFLTKQRFNLLNGSLYISHTVPVK